MASSPRYLVLEGEYFFAASFYLYLNAYIQLGRGGENGAGINNSSLKPQCRNCLARIAANPK